MGATTRAPLALSLVLLAGCASQSKYMQAVPPGQANYAPDAQHALVVFLRPSKFGGAIQAAVFDTTGEPEALVGIVSSRSKVAYKVPAGEREFMVLSEAADFASANLEANKTYYMRVVARPGFWKARFSLAPVPRAALDDPKLQSHLDASTWRAKNELAEEWYRDHAGDIADKRARYHEKWMGKAEADRPRLLPEDGVPAG